MSKLPLIAFASLMHLGIAFTIPILRCGRRCNECRIDVDGGVSLQAASSLLQMIADLSEDRRGQILPLQQMAKTEERGRIRPINLSRLVSFFFAVNSRAHKPIPPPSPVIQPFRGWPPRLSG